MSDLFSLALGLAALLAPVDLVRSGFAIPRATAHDRALLRLLVFAVPILATVDLVAGVILGLGVLGAWRDGDRRCLLLTAGLAAAWLSAPALHPSAPLLATGWVVLALAESAVTWWHWGALRGWWPGQVRAQHLPVRPLSGFRGQHTIFAAGLALVLPFAWSVHWSLGLLLFASILGISCWTGILAALVGITVLRPELLAVTTMLLLLGLALVVPKAWKPERYVHIWIDRFTPRGGSLDSLRLRWRSWGVLLGAMRHWPWRVWLTGRGWTGPNRDLLRAHALQLVPGAMGTSHNDVLDVVYTSGLPGLLLLGLLGWRLAPALMLGDPWSATVCAGLVVACGSSALRYPSVGLVWWLSAALLTGRS